jgi:hypothetical protein
MTTPSVQPPQLWPEQWAVHVAVEADRLENKVRVALDGRPRDLSTGPSSEAIRHHIGIARAASQRTNRRPFRGFRDQLRGTSVDQAYRNLHTAKVFSLDLLSDADVDALIPDVAARLATVLDRNDPRRTQTEQSLRSRDTVVRRGALKQAMEIAYDASDEEYTRLRDFRNIILLTAALISGCMWILAVVAAANPQYLPVCFTPTADVTATVCPSGAGQPTSAGDLLIVAGLGALGGGLAALLAIRNLRGTSTPYSLPVALAVLKVPSGALTAVAGLLLLGGGFAPGFSDLDSQRQILAYALVFGYAQQVATRLVDNRAQLVLNKVPSKDPEGKQPDQPVTATTVIETPQAVPYWPTNGQRPRRAARVRQAALRQPTPDGMSIAQPPAPASA